MQAGGYQFLFDLFTTIDKKNIDQDIIKTKVLSLLLKLESHLFSYKQVSVFKQTVTPAHIEVLMRESL